MDIIYFCLFLIPISSNKKNIRDVFLKYLNVNKIGGGVHYRSVTNMKNYKSLFNWNKKRAQMPMKLAIISLVFHYIQG